jgi:hypothetical protein
MRRNTLRLVKRPKNLTWIEKESDRMKREEKNMYVHSCHSMVTGENKADLTLALPPMLMPLAFPSNILLIHHRLLPTHSTLLCDGEDPTTTSRLSASDSDISSLRGLYQQAQQGVVAPPRRSSMMWPSTSSCSGSSILGAAAVGAIFELLPPLVNRSVAPELLCVDRSFPSAF